MLGHAGGQQRDRAVRGDHAPVAIDGERRVWVVAFQHALQRVTHRLHVRFVQPALTVRRRVARGEQQLVAVAQRDVELLGEMDDHLGAGPCPAGLDEADMPGGHVRLEREVQLAQAPPLAPLAQQRPDADPFLDLAHRHER